jgi:hypothetical protein
MPNVTLSIDSSRGAKKFLESAKTIQGNSKGKKQTREELYRPFCKNKATIQHARNLTK